MTDKVQRLYQLAERTEFPPVPDDQVWCAVRGLLVGVSECATDACVAPEQRPVCWEGHIARQFAEQES